MRLRNGQHGYGLVTKTLHWVTVAAVVAQFAVGVTMEADGAAFDQEDDRIDELEDRGEEAAERGGEAEEEAFEDYIDRLESELDAREDEYVGAAFVDMFTGDGLRDGLALPEIHVLLGLSLIALGLLRVLWRNTTPLPPWAPYLSKSERSLESALERVMLFALLLVPATGLVLVAVSVDWLWAHLAAQLLFVVAIGAHVAVVLRHTAIHRDGELHRML